MLEAEQKKKKAHEASAIGKLQAFGHNVGKLVGTAESESEPESDVSALQRLFYCVFFVCFLWYDWPVYLSATVVFWT